MKTQIKIHKIEDPKINVKINSPLERILEIKKEIKNYFNLDTCKAPVLDMWEDEQENL